MKILDRYVIAEFIRFYFAMIVVLALVFYVAEFLRGEAETTAIKLLIYNSFQLPTILVQMTPAAAMLATMATLSMLSRRNELIAMQAGGIGLVHITMLILGVIFIVCCVSLMMTDRVSPPLARLRMSYYWSEIKGRKDFSLDIKSSKIWYRSKNYIYNLQTFDKATNSIQGFGIYFFDDKFQLKQHLEATTATFVGDQWFLKDGMMTVFSDNTMFPLSKHFDSKTFQLPETPRDFLEIEKQVESLRLKDLRAFIRRNKTSGLKTSSYEVDFHSRITLSFIPLVMALLVVPYSVRPRRQEGLGRDIAICVGLILVYWILFSISLSLGRSGAVEPWMAVWAPSFLFLSAAIYLIVRK